jgi:hypothetical protein
MEGIKVFVITLFTLPSFTKLYCKFNLDNHFLILPFLQTILDSENYKIMSL